MIGKMSQGAEEKLHIANIETDSEKKRRLNQRDSGCQTASLFRRNHTISLQQVIKCGSSYRGVEHFELYEIFSEATPSFSSVRKWLGELGCMNSIEKKKEEMIGFLLLI